MRCEAVAYAKIWRLAVGGKGEAEVGIGVGGCGRGGGGVLVGGGAWRRRGEGEVVDGELLNLIEAGAGEVGGCVAGVKFEGLEGCGFGVGFGGDGVGFGVAVLEDGEVEVAGIDGLQRGGDVDGGRFGGGLPLRFDLFAGRGVDGDLVDAGGAGGAEGEVVVLAGDEGVTAGDLPILAGCVLQAEDGAGEGIEAPVAFDDAGDGVGGRRRRRSGRGGGG